MESYDLVQRKQVGLEVCHMLQCNCEKLDAEKHFISSNDSKHVNRSNTQLRIKMVMNGVYNKTPCNLVQILPPTLCARFFDALSGSYRLRKTILNVKP